MADSTNENNPSPSDNETTLSAERLLHLIQTLPKEQGLALLREHWQLLLRDKPGLELAGIWGQLQIRPSNRFDTPPNQEES